MRAAKACPVRFDPVPEDPAAAMIARRRQRLDGAFEAVKRMRLAVHDDVERLVVVVPAGFALWHGSAPIKCERRALTLRRVTPVAERVVHSARDYTQNRFPRTPLSSGSARK